jgi:hypothetical protein
MPQRLAWNNNEEGTFAHMFEIIQILVQMTKQNSHKNYRNLSTTKATMTTGNIQIGFPIGP